MRLTSSIVLGLLLQLSVRSQAAEPLTESPAFRLTLIHSTNGHTGITLSGSPNSTYLLEARDRLGAWSALALSSPIAAGIHFVDSFNPLHSVRFYRAQLLSEWTVKPFTSWVNLKTDFGAVGDGVTDDTMALQFALSFFENSRGEALLFVPAGTYRITQTCGAFASVNSGIADIMIVGENPQNTIIRWDGMTNGVMLDFAGYAPLIGRLTLDDGGKAATVLAQGVGSQPGP